MLEAFSFHSPVPFYNLRPFNFKNVRIMQRGPHFNNSNGNKVHDEKTLPPSSCKISLQNKITNAFHWHQICPFATQANNSSLIGTENNSFNSQG